MTELTNSLYWGLLVLGITIGFGFGVSIGIDYGNRFIIIYSSGIGLSISLILLVISEFKRVGDKKSD